MGPWELEDHTAVEHSGWTATYELLRRTRTSDSGSCTAAATAAGELTYRSRAAVAEVV